MCTSAHCILSLWGSHLDCVGLALEASVAPHLALLDMQQLRQYGEFGSRRTVVSVGHIKVNLLIWRASESLLQRKSALAICRNVAKTLRRA